MHVALLNIIAVIFNRMLLIIQNGFVTPSITRYLHSPYEIVKSFEVDVSKCDIDKYSIFIFLGGHQSVTKIKQYPYLLNVISLIKKCITFNKSIIGICLGCQLVAYALECKINSMGNFKIGFDVPLLGKKNIFRCHEDYIVANNNIQVKETFENIPYLYTSGQNIIGIQCHPDASPESVIENCADKMATQFANSNTDLINNNNQYIIDYLLANKI